MKTLLTCDDVFDVLTREPFPSGGADDEVVEAHLAVCHECRQLAEAFRPAVGLFHESLAAHGDDGLPAYRGRMQPILAALKQESTPPRGNSANTNTRALFGLIIAASLLLAGSVVLATLAAQPRSGGSMASESHAASAVLSMRDRDYTLLAALEIPDNCRSLVETAGQTNSIEFVCCTNCHNATSRVASTNLAILKSSAACAACHSRMPGEGLSAVVPRRPSCDLLLACVSVHNL